MNNPTVTVKPTTLTIVDGHLTDGTTCLCGYCLETDGGPHCCRSAHPQRGRGSRRPWAGPGGRR
jgi:hypothetical protein